MPSTSITSSSRTSPSPPHPKGLQAWRCRLSLHHSRECFGSNDRYDHATNGAVCASELSEATQLDGCEPSAMRSTFTTPTPSSTCATTPYTPSASTTYRHHGSDYGEHGVAPEAHDEAPRQESGPRGHQEGRHHQRQGRRHCRQGGRRHGQARRGRRAHKVVKKWQNWKIKPRRPLHPQRALRDSHRRQRGHPSQGVQVPDAPTPRQTSGSHDSSISEVGHHTAGAMLQIQEVRGRIIARAISKSTSRTSVGTFAFLDAVRQKPHCISRYPRRRTKRGEAHFRLEQHGHAQEPHHRARRNDQSRGVDIAGEEEGTQGLLRGMRPRARPQPILRLRGAQPGPRVVGHKRLRANRALRLERERAALGLCCRHHRGRENCRGASATILERSGE